MVKRWLVIYRSRYYPFEGDHRRYVWAESKKQVREHWPDLICTDEYKIVRIEESTNVGMPKVP